MKRLHVGVEVADLPQSIAFYSHLFGCAPSVSKPDYAKWMLDDPRVNFSIARRGREPGVDHLGIQVDSADELEAISAALQAAGEQVHRQDQTTCCYAVSDKGWVIDPQGIAWETFHTTAAADEYGSDTIEGLQPAARECGCPGARTSCC